VGKNTRENRLPQKYRLEQKPLKNHPKKIKPTHQIMMWNYTCYKATCIPQPHHLGNKNSRKIMAPSKPKNLPEPPKTSPAAHPAKNTTSIRKAATCQTTYGKHTPASLLKIPNNTPETHNSKQQMLPRQGAKKTG